MERAAKNRQLDGIALLSASDNSTSNVASAAKAADN
jgi:hypothetical protein